MKTDEQNKIDEIKRRLAQCEAELIKVQEQIPKQENPLLHLSFLAFGIVGFFALFLIFGGDGATKKASHQNTATAEGASYTDSTHNEKSDYGVVSAPEIPIFKLERDCELEWNQMNATKQAYLYGGGTKIEMENAQIRWRNCMVVASRLRNTSRYANMTAQAVRKKISAEEGISKGAFPSIQSINKIIADVNAD